MIEIRLSERETQVLQGMCLGHTNAQSTNTMTHTTVECDRRGLLGRDNHRARRVRRELADRHSSTCALLQTPVCNCTPDDTTQQRKENP